MLQARRWIAALGFSTAVLAAFPALAAGRVIYMTFDTSDDYVYRIEDLNGDGDALDAGENVQYAPYSDYIEGLAVDKNSGDVYIAEESNEVIYRLRDLNGDGDAMDAGEKTLWADDTSRDCSDIEDIAIDESTGTVYSTFEDAGCIVWHRDNNADGDALDSGESGLLTNVGSDLESITADSSTGNIFAGDNASPDVVHRLSSAGASLGDISGTGHESNDFAESTSTLYSGQEDFSEIVKWVGGTVSHYATVPDGGYSEALAANPANNEVFVGTENGNIYLLQDNNSDGDADDSGESIQFSDGSLDTEVEAMGIYPGTVSQVPATSPLTLLLLAAGLATAGYAAMRR